MAKNKRASIREALEAATSGTGVANQANLQGSSVKNEEDEEPQVPAAEETLLIEETPDVPAEEQRAGVGPQATRRRGRPRKVDQAERGEARRRGRPRMDEGHRKTSTGYMTSAGQQIVRLTLHLTPEQKRNLKIKSLEAGYENASAFLIEKLEL
jgi:hypothetical protein